MVPWALPCDLHSPSIWWRRADVRTSEQQQQQRTPNRRKLKLQWFTRFILFQLFFFLRSLQDGEKTILRVGLFFLVLAARTK